jgi:flavin-binding protein dodecin
MDEHVYKKLELTGSSKISMEDSIKNAIKRRPEPCGICDGLRWLNLGDISKITRLPTGRLRSKLDLPLKITNSNPLLTEENHV